jgi:hypothetical protein
LIGHSEIVSATLARTDESTTRSRKARQRFDGSLNFTKKVIGRAAFCRRKLAEETSGEFAGGCRTTKKATKNSGSEQRGEKQKEGDEPDPRHWWKTAVAASFPT